MANEDQNWTQALDELRNAPMREGGRNGSLKTRISAALDDILAFRNKGYSDADILGILKQNGIATTIATLRHYIGVAKRSRRETTAQRRSIARGRAVGIDARSVGERMTSVHSNGDAIGDRKLIEGGLNVVARTISSEAPKPARQSGKTAGEVLGHRLDDSEL